LYSKFYFFYWFLS